MKKILLILTVLLVCVSVCATAAAPSKTAGDTTTVTTTPTKTTATRAQTEELQAIEAPIIPSKRADLLEWADKAIAKLNAAESVEAFFNDFTLSEQLKSEDLEVNELVPIEVTAQKFTQGDTEFTLNFATPYKKGEALLVMLGFKSEADDLEWKTLNGVGNADGSVNVKIPKNEMAHIYKDNGALLAVVNAAN